MSDTRIIKLELSVEEANLVYSSLQERKETTPYSQPEYKLCKKLLIDILVQFDDED